MVGFQAAQWVNSHVPKMNQTVGGCGGPGCCSSCKLGSLVFTAQQPCVSPATGQLITTRHIPASYLLGWVSLSCFFLAAVSQMCSIYPCTHTSSEYLLRPFYRQSHHRCWDVVEESDMLPALKELTMQRKGLCKQVGKQIHQLQLWGTRKQSVVFW